jgi:hypothetical protein
MKPTSLPATYSPRQLLIYWLIWMVGNVACVFLNIYLHTFLILVAWIFLVLGMQGYLFSQLHRPPNETGIQRLWHLLLLAGIIFSIIEAVYIYWFLEGCFFAADCFWVNL